MQRRMWYTIFNNKEKEKRSSMAKDDRLAILIDADNVSEKYIKYILDEVSGDGTATYKRIYGDWTKPELASWKNVLLCFLFIILREDMP